MAHNVVNMTDTGTAWDALTKLPRNDIDAALAWRRRFTAAMGADDGLGEALLHLFDDPRVFLTRAAAEDALKPAR